MYQVIVRQGKRILRREEFSNEDCAWAFFDVMQDKGFSVEFKALGLRRYG